MGASALRLAELDLDRRVVDVELRMERRGRPAQKGVAGMACRHDQVDGERGLGGAEGPDVQVMHLGDAREIAQPGSDGGEVDPLRHAVEQHIVGPSSMTGTRKHSR